MILYRSLKELKKYYFQKEHNSIPYTLKSNSIHNLKKMENSAINLSKLKDMIKNGISRIPKDPNADEAIIVIGDTGAGKSTILAFLSGAKLFVRY